MQYIHLVTPIPPFYNYLQFPSHLLALLVSAYAQQTSADEIPPVRTINSKLLAPMTPPPPWLQS
jgi:hypothetical protein